jgi:hypothetical protein
MPLQIKAIHLSRFRKFKDSILCAKQNNVLVGANNSGKTSILHALRLFFLSLVGEFSGPTNNITFHKRYISVDKILPVADSEELWTNCQKGNTKSTGIIIEVEYETGLKIEAVFTHRFGQVHVDANILSNPGALSGHQINDAISHKLAFIPGLVGILPQESYVTPARRSAMSNETRYSEMYRSSLLHLNKTDKNALREINAILKKYLNVEITSIDFDPDKDVFVDIKYSQNGIELDIANAGSGMLQIIQLLVYIFLHKPTLLLIDEPDAHLHPELQEKVGPVLKDVSGKMQAQLFIATHSPDVIDSFKSEEVFFINADKKILSPLPNESDYVDGLIESGIITSSSLSRLAVRPKCLIVEDRSIGVFKAIDGVMGTRLFESPSDYNQAKGVSKFPGIHEVYLTVQRIVGKKISMFFIQDRDGLPDRFVGYIQSIYRDRGLNVKILKRHEIENYLLDGKTIRAALEARSKSISLKDCRCLLIKAAQEIKASTRGDIRRKCKDVNHFCNKPDGLDDNAVESEVDNWFDGLAINEENVLNVFPGKELIKALRRTISDEQGIDLRESDLRAALTKDRLSDDIKNIFLNISRERLA